MTKTKPGRPMIAEDEMIQDIIETPIEEIRAELREEGRDPDRVASNLRARLARAQETVIQRRLAAAQVELKGRGKPPAPDRMPKTIDDAYSADGLTMAARNATRPMGLSDPSVDDDLNELRSGDWTRD
ncbi:hypothetical protein RAH32_18195 [Paracoccus sp. WLY502]|uniref:hypothetical protein n=1 Tax=Paracoccus yibinensis TaxID=3068891 RepID=UPI002796A763|nr:hypothetical protein [Paracoccus sp. WLY502]MDQ1902354.1 hypothetical protein [Paracoccus sp. WLY502]